MALDEYASSADYYDYVEVYRHRPDVGLYVEESVRSGGPVLELGCGSGRVLVPTARAGVEITGLDASPRMLARCAALLDGENIEIRSRASLVAGDMRGFSLDREFALVTIPFRPFQHLLTVDDQIACLTCIRRHLSEAGRLIFDIFNPSLEILVNTPLGEELQIEEPFSLPDGRQVQRKSKIVRHDRLNQVTDHELIYYITDGGGYIERVIHAFSLRNTFKFEMEHLLSRLGFTVENVFADFGRTPFGSKYPGELIFVAKKA
jgi:SAM-dependent methyltransferase